MVTPLGPGAEFDLIRAFLAGGVAADQPHVVVGPGDDCAVLAPALTAVSVDLSIEGVHFRRDWLEPEEIGYRSAAAALSDLAAMAALPRGILVALGVPAGDHGDYVTRVMRGAREAAEALGTTIIGGDVTRIQGPLVLDCVVLGECRMPITRAGARPDDELWVTGELGAAKAAVLAWQHGQAPAAAARSAFARPRPRVAEALWLAEQGLLHALIDISDGLAGDAGHLAAASGVRVVLDGPAVPVHAALSSLADSPAEALRAALSGGDDYELCFAAPPHATGPLADTFQRQFGLRLTRVGSIAAGRGVSLRDLDGVEQELGYTGFDHFRDPEP